jgi:hypothetical protein
MLFLGFLKAALPLPVGPVCWADGKGKKKYNEDKLK